MILISAADCSSLEVCLRTRPDLLIYEVPSSPKRCVGCIKWRTCRERSEAVISALPRYARVLFDPMEMKMNNYLQRRGRCGRAKTDVSRLRADFLFSMTASASQLPSKQWPSGGLRPSAMEEEAGDGLGALGDCRY